MRVHANAQEYIDWNKYFSDYPIGSGLYAPPAWAVAYYVLSQGYSVCDSTISTRPFCVAKAYATAVNDADLQAPPSQTSANWDIHPLPYSDGYSLTWDAFLALTFVGEAGPFYTNPNRNPQLDLQFSIPQEQFKLFFESAVFNQLYAATDNDGASSVAEFVKFLAGPPFDQWGIQAWYNNVYGKVSDTLDTLKGYKNGTPFYHYIDNAQNVLNGNAINGVIRWGNPNTREEVAHSVAYVTYLDEASVYGRVNENEPNRVYFIIR